jgi:hypothetical protein
MEMCFDWPPSNQCPILISMDEVHVLFNGSSDSDESTHTLYSRLKSVLSEVVDESFCVVVLSTATNITKLPPRATWRHRYGKVRWTASFPLHSRSFLSMNTFFPNGLLPGE